MLPNETTFWFYLDFHDEYKTSILRYMSISLSADRFLSQYIFGTAALYSMYIFPSLCVIRHIILKEIWDRFYSEYTHRRYYIKKNFSCTNVFLSWYSSGSRLPSIHKYTQYVHGNIYSYIDKVLLATER